MQNNLLLLNPYTYCRIYSPFRLHVVVIICIHAFFFRYSFYILTQLVFCVRYNIKDFFLFLRFLIPRFIIIIIIVCVYYICSRRYNIYICIVL